MKNEVTIKEKILILIILTIAAGFFLLQPPTNSVRGKITAVEPKIDEKKDKNTVQCKYQNDELSKILDNQEVNQISQDCLFIGCNGFTY